MMDRLFEPPILPGNRLLPAESLSLGALEAEPELTETVTK